MVRKDGLEVEGTTADPPPQGMIRLLFQARGKEQEYRCGRRRSWTSLPVENMMPRGQC